ncbi:SOS response-associated peptidase family protein [Microvirga sp. BT291]|nr:SOS response-associated peptidase family protein [Microvirga pudoricolor]
MAVKQRINTVASVRLANIFAGIRKMTPRKYPIFSNVSVTDLGARDTKNHLVEGGHHLFSFLTTEPNAEVKPIHPKAMPVILTTDEEYEAWLTAPLEEALKLQRPLPDGTLEIVARGERADPSEAA